MNVFLLAVYSVILLGEGVLHFFMDNIFRRIINTILLFRNAAVVITGMFEIIFTSLLWVKKGQHITSKLLAFFMIAIFPANIYMAIKRIPLQGRGKANPWLVWLRLPLQFSLIVGALKLGRR